MDRASVKTDTQALSPVIGSVLLLAIVVALATLVGAYAMELRHGLNDGDQPQIQFDQTYDRENDPTDGERLVVSHERGSDIDSNLLTVSVEDAVVRDASTDSLVGDAQLKDPTFIRNEAGQTFQASDTVTIDKSRFEMADGTAIASGEYVDLSEATVRIQWTNSNVDDEGRSAIIYTWSGEDA